MVALMIIMLINIKTVYGAHGKIKIPKVFGNNFGIDPKYKAFTESITPLEVKNMFRPSRSVLKRNLVSTDPLRTPAILVDNLKKPRGIGRPIMKQMRARHTDKTMKMNHSRLFEIQLKEIGEFKRYYGYKGPNHTLTNSYSL